MMGLYFILMLTRLLQKRGWPAWGVVVGSALLAPPATALVEATWYALVRHIDFWEVLSANIDPDMSPRPSHGVALAGLAFIVVYVARNWRIGEDVSDPCRRQIGTARRRRRPAACRWRRGPGGRPPARKGQPAR